MSLPVVARIPQDNGREIRYDSTNKVKVEPCPCEGDGCAEPAELLIKGEQDSFGWEPMFLCEACYQTMRSEVTAHYEAGDVEDRAPKADHVFMVSECTNVDGHGEWLRTFTSYRKAVGYYRRIEDAAAAWAGLYPNRGVLEVPKVKAEEARKQRNSEEDDQLLKPEDLIFPSR